MGIKQLMGLNAWAATLVARTTKHDGSKKRKRNTWAHTGGVICGFDETPIHQLRDFLFADGTFYREEVQKKVQHPDGRVQIYVYLIDPNGLPLSASRWSLEEESSCAPS